MPKDLIFTNLMTGSHVLIKAQVWDTISQFTSDDEIKVEAGGVFIGCYRGPHIEITDCTVPFPGDNRLRMLFDRKDPMHQQKTHSLWRNSKQTKTYVGEWHTHNELVPSPSGLDRRTWNDVQQRFAFGKRPLFFMILGRQDNWAGNANGYKLARNNQT
ncbi:MAG: Mov34/MPN/PAD-1 family protein [Terasakiella sp.]|uniref:Mov34/MPN/PAD-1 family protein n=1 Tax=unclassified Terasakiella TaxID=2614952 RepID=UPI003AFFF49B